MLKPLYFFQPVEDALLIEPVAGSGALNLVDKLQLGIIMDDLPRQARVLYDLAYFKIFFNNTVPERL